MYKLTSKQANRQQKQQDIHKITAYILWLLQVESVNNSYHDVFCIAEEKGWLAKRKETKTRKRKLCTQSSCLSVRTVREIVLGVGVHSNISDRQLLWQFHIHSIHKVCVYPPPPASLMYKLILQTSMSPGQKVVAVHPIAGTALSNNILVGEKDLLISLLALQM